MKKVLYAATTTSHIKCFHLPYLKYFKDHGYVVHTLTNSDEPILYTDKHICMPISRNPFKLSNIKSIFKLKKLIKQEKYDLIITNTPVCSAITRLANKYKSKLIYIAHGFHFYNGAPFINWLIYYPIEKYLAKYTDVLITINKEDYKRACAFKTRVEYLPGIGLNTKKMKNNMDYEDVINLRKSLNIKLTDFVMIYTAELNKNKNQLFILKCMKYLNKYNIHLLLPGVDNLNGKLQKYVKDKDIKNVHFLGYRNDISKLLTISDLAVSSSRREGLPFNIIEAIYMGLPTLVSNVRGNRDLVNPDSIFNSEKEFISKVENYYNKKASIKNINVNAYLLHNVMPLFDKIINQKRVLHVLSSDKFNGSSKEVCTIIKHMKDYNMAYCSPSGQINYYLKNIPFYKLKKFSIHELKKQICKYKPDIIDAHDYKASIFCSFLKKNKVLISHIDKVDPKVEKFSLKALIYKLSIPKYNYVIGNNNVLNKAIFKDSLKDKYLVIPNYIDKQEIINLSKEYTCPKKYDIFFIGRLTKQKDPLRFIEIIKQIDNPKIRAVMIGTGPLYNECLTIIKENHLNIDLLGFVANPFPIILKCKIGIIPSTFEGLSLTIIESAVLNKPILNSSMSEVYQNHKELICKTNEDYIKKINKKYNVKDISSKYEDYDYWCKLYKKIYKG